MKKVKSKAKFHIYTEQSDRQNTEKMELTTDGLFWVENDSIYLQYDESKTTGFEGCTTTIRTEKDVVYINRDGEYSAGMVIEKSKEHYGHYITPMGSIDVATRSYSVKNELNKDGGRLYLRYGVYVNGTFLNLTKMLITAELIENKK